MEYNYQVGSLAWHRAQLTGLNVEIEYAGLWRSLNDHVNYRMGVDGFGQHDITFRRKTVTSDFFDGEYLVRKTADSIKRAWTIGVMGGDRIELETNLVNLRTWFTQDSYNVRVSLDDYMETMLCDAADLSIDGSHVFMHNTMYSVRVNFATDAKVSQEQIL